MSKKLTTEEFIKKAREVHGNKYDYSKVEYVNNRSKVCIICPEHGEFWQIPNSHLNGNGCKRCHINRISLLKKITTEEFIKKAREVHGNKYDYSKVEYTRSNQKVCIICPEHGEFWQEANTHLQGEGCKKCGVISSANNRKLTTEEFIKKADKIHNNKYDYSKVEYVNTKIPVCIICSEHGEFWQKPYNHLSGRGCPRCGREKTENGNRLTVEEFIKKAREVHGNKYDYSKVEYKHMEEKVCIICPIHGEFWQTPHNHLRYGCSKCKDSKMETAVRNILRENKILFEEQKTFEWLKYKQKMYLDFYLPEYNIAIECQGEQHFTKYRFENDNEKFKMRQTRDKIKNKLCIDKGIKVIYYSDIPKYETFLGEKIIKNKEKLIEKIYG